MDEPVIEEVWCVTQPDLCRSRVGAEGLTISFACARRCGVRAGMYCTACYARELGLPSGSSAGACVAELLRRAS